MATNTYLVISDGTTTCTFFDGTSPGTAYSVDDSFVPSVAGLRDDDLAGRGPVGEVIESWQVRITGADAATVLTNIQTLNNLIQQAERLERGESVTAVTVRYSPKGGTVSSTGTPLQARILGRVPGEQNALTLASPFDWKLGESFRANATLRFVRMGQWLHSEANASSSATDNGDLATITLAATTNNSPTRFSVTNFGMGFLSGVAYHGGFLAVSDIASTIEIVNAETGTATGWTSVADSGASARNTNVLRYTPTGTSESLSGDILSAAALTTSARLVAVYANIRNNSTTVTYLLKARVYATSLKDTPYVQIPVGESSPFPTWVFLGVVPCSTQPSDVFLAATASATGSTLDIDTVVLIDVTNPTTNVVSIEKVTDHATASGGTLDINHNLLTDFRATLTTTPGGGSTYHDPNKGDLFFQTKGGTIYCLIMATGAGSGGVGNRWRQFNSPSLLSNTFTAYRRTAYLTPV